MRICTSCLMACRPTGYTLAEVRMAVLTTKLAILQIPQRVTGRFVCLLMAVRLAQ